MKGTIQLKTGRLVIGLLYVTAWVRVAPVGHLSQNIGMRAGDAPAEQYILVLSQQKPTLIKHGV